MSEPIDDGGNAFPITETDPQCGTRAWPGMTLRDYFAASVLPGMYQEWTDTDPGWAKGLAEAAYKLADAMIAERERK